MGHYDVIVIGLGGMGSAAAAHLASRGRRVLGLDRYAPPHDRGSSHGRTRVIRQAYFEHPAYVPLLLRAYELWRELELAVGRSVLRVTGGLMMGAPGAEVVTGSFRSAREHGLAHESLDAREIRRRYPVFRIGDEVMALFESEAGVVFCEKAVSAHLEVAARAGAELRFGGVVGSWEVADGGGPVRVSTGAGVDTAEQLVIAVGPWAPEFLKGMGLPLVVERQVLLWFRPDGGVGPYLPERFPVYIYQAGDGAIPYGFPALDGAEGGVKAAFFRKPISEVCTPETVDRKVRRDDEEGLRAELRGFLPGLAGEVVWGQTCLYTLTPDLNFVVGMHPRYPQVKVAAGFSGHGFKFCPVIGAVLADLVVAGRTRFDMGLFDPRRFGGCS